MIRFQSVSKRFGEKTVLQNFSCSIAEGQTNCLIGPSGCGKTTFLRLASGLLQPDSGSIHSPTRFSFVFQEDRLLPWFSTLENITCLGIAKDKAIEWLSALGLQGEMDQPIASLSGGMQSRVCLARAMAFDADAYCLDEPFRGLDASTAQKAICAMKPALQGKTVLLTTHHPMEASEIADHFMLVSGPPFRIERMVEKAQTQAETLEQWMNH